MLSVKSALLALACFVAIVPKDDALRAYREGAS